MGQEEIDAVAGVLRSGWIGLGPRTAEFEQRFAALSDVPYAVGLNSGTAALDLAMKLLGVGRGDEVLVPTITFVSTAHVVVHNLASPIFVDVEPHTLNIDVEDMARKITPRTKAVIVVHYGGRPVDMDAVKDRVGGLPIVEDCAHATGSRYDGQPVGGLGAIGCFSFHAVKNVAMGDGGALTLRSREWYERARRLRWLGIDRTTWDRTGLDQSYWWRYRVDEPGMKCHMNDIAAAIGLVQLDRLPWANGRRRALVERYFEGLCGLEEVELPASDDDTYESAWHIFHIKCRDRNGLSAFLQQCGVATGVHYMPIHTYACYGSPPILPHAESVQDRILTLPLYPGLTDDEVVYIVERIAAFYRRCRR